MPDTGNVTNPGAGVAQPAAPGSAPAQNRVQELRVSANLMGLQAGLYCMFPKPGSPLADRATGLPCVRVSLPPHAVQQPNGVEISTFNGEGWLTHGGDAAMVRVPNGPAQVLVTVYQAPGNDPAPQLQVVQLSASGAPAAPARVQKPVEPGAGDVVAHIQRRGDVVCKLGEWCGERGSKAWVEGFSVRLPAEIADSDIEYQAVLGRGWLSPWMKGGEFCGSRGMALPVLGLRVRLTGAAAERWDCVSSASFGDGTQVGPVPGGEACEAESLAPLEAFLLALSERGASAKPVPKPASAAAAGKKPVASAKPAAAKRRS